MATLGSPSPPNSPSGRRRRNFVRRCERFCCNIILYFPLTFVYGLTTWAVWVEVNIGLSPSKTWTGTTSNLIGIILYLLLNWSYTAAVFTNPGSPLDSKGGYSQLPTSETPAYSSFTVKSTGDIRFCKKCQTKKPDRAHHCSTCKRCVLKMDHHCPWLATCVGLRNYKLFILFLVYVSLFCWMCLAVSMAWLYSEVLSDGQYLDSLMPVNFILLAVISGIIGLVISGFTAWHLYLTGTGFTTIEKLEKTRYLSPLRKSMQYHPPERNYLDSQGNRQSIGEQLHEIHANALPGVLRPEEGEDSRSASPAVNGSSPAQQSLRRNYHDIEQQREQDRYSEYLEEQDSDSLPHAFDLGWRRNFAHIFGPSKLLWPIPIVTTSGDGWSWEPSPKWIRARDQIRRKREAQSRAQKERERAAGWGHESPNENARTPKPTWYGYSTGNGPDEEPDGRYLTTSSGVTTVTGAPRRSPGKADSILGRIPGTYAEDGQGTPMQILDRKRIIRDPDQELLDEVDDYDTSSDEELASKKQLLLPRNGTPMTRLGATENWNDVPDDILNGSQRGGKGPSASRSRDRRKNGKDWESWSPQ